MWTLFIITLLPQIDDAKVVRFNEYKSEQACLVAAKKLEKTFKHDEIVVCELKPSHNDKIESKKEYFWLGIY